MSSFQPHEIIRFQKRHKKLQKFFKRMGFTGNIPLSLDFESLSFEEKKTIINEVIVAYDFVETLHPRAIVEFCNLIDADEETMTCMVLSSTYYSN